MVLDRLVAFDQANVQCIDSTTAKVHRCGAGGDGGAQTQAIGRSRGGRTTKVHVVVDGLGRLLSFILTPGNRHDLPPAAGLIEPLPKAKSLLADAAYDSNAFRAFLTDRGTTPDIKQNPTRKRLHPFDQQAYRGRNVIERAFCRLKDWRRVATRYDKLARNYAATVVLAAIFRWWI
jgi:transposase